MGRKGRKDHRENKIYTYLEFLEKTKTCTIKCLLEIGNRICFTDFAVRFYNNKQHPQFYRQRDKVEKAIRRAYHQNAFNHRQQAEEIMAKHDPLAFEDYVPIA
ncbi:MAG: hypothetical protein DDT32_01904 [Syntrophomonadaceae bacterium]|nr:hypothetical protein [Bacillota bacterium]